VAEYPAWYPAWRNDAFAQLKKKCAALNCGFKLGEWDRYDYDLSTGTLTYSKGGTPRVIAEIQIAGTTSVAAGTWLWAWANPDWPPELTKGSKLVRNFGQEHGVCDLLHDHIDGDECDLNSLGWELTAAAVRITGALGAYRPPRDEGGGLYLLITNVSWAT
jgi:hypothetical protein